MKIAIHAGHTSQSGRAPGAYGIVSESTEARKIVRETIKILRKAGHAVVDCTAEGANAGENLYLITAKSNNSSADIVVSIHLNCFNGSAYGAETLVFGKFSKSATVAERIQRRIVALGFSDRGVKERPDLYVLRHTNAPAMLVECFFCDSKKDVTIYKKVGAKGLAMAIAKGIDPKVGKEQEPKVLFRGVVTKKKLAVRSRPSTVRFTRYATFRRGEIVKVYGIRGKFYQVSKSGRHWAMKKYVKRLEGGAK